jgi:hypothetical protein
VVNLPPDQAHPYQEHTPDDQFKESHPVVPPVLTDTKRLVYRSGVFFQPLTAFSFLRQLCPAFVGEYHHFTKRKPE